MPASTAMPGFGTILQINDGGYKSVGLIKSVAGPNMSMSPIDVTNMESPNAHTEYIAGVRDGGTVSCEVSFDYDNTEHDFLITSFQAGTKCSWKVIFPNTNATTCAFDAFITALDFSATIPSEVTMSISLKVSGMPVWTA